MVRFVLRAGFCLAALPLAAHAQGTGSGRLALIQNGDTSIVETYTRTADVLTSEIIQKSGGRVKFTAKLLPDASIETMDLSMSQAGQTQQALFTFKGDTIVMQSQGATRSAPGKAGAVPTLPMSFALFEQALLRAKKMGGQTPTVALFRVGQERIVYGVVTKPSADSAYLTVDGSAPLRFKVDDQGRILSGMSGNTGISIVRIP
jgi:hypothetical protein